MSFDITPQLKAAIEKTGCKGALAAISRNGIVETFSAGSITAADHGRAFYIYSISKTFTAVALLKLCEDGRDFLDETFRSLMPEAPIPDGITVRQLLNHSGGLSDYFSSREYQEAVTSHPTKPWSHEKLMEVGLRGTPLFPPGEGWAYSNPAYGLLKKLIESLSGMGYYDFLLENVLAGLGLRDTRAFVAPDVNLELLEGEAPGFEGDFRRLYRPEWIVTGCLISTVTDVARFYDALFGGKIVSETSLRKMMETVDVLKTSPAVSIPANGLGLMHFRKDPLGDAYGHGGGGPGYTTYARHYPDLKGAPFTLSLVLNMTLPQTPFALADEIVRAFLDRAG
ncbi:beta-lactamase family protein [Luteolibacter arcticus]|uniref:Beta-lactamase family protein n=1 Tax=Luteolibacter arcticus TaxID=1581411 RepID=A0ABT3GL67_9BACT|nr:serine hydrolase domain-containing protein [Luteolibacter arcticus]MCW1924242.1 beta-lactamase family protein [Luteolibacter arcticus]